MLKTFICENCKTFHVSEDKLFNCAECGMGTHAYTHPSNMIHADNYDENTMPLPKQDDKDWFNNNLVVGAYPYINTISFDDGYDYVINVSDEYYDDNDDYLKSNHGVKKTYWFPMNEQSFDIGLNSLYGAMVILYNAEKQNKMVYLHCHAGTNRSQIIRAAFHFMMYNEHYIGGDDRNINKLVRACNNKYLPPKHKMEQFLIELKLQLNGFNGKPLGGLIDHIRNEILK